VIIGGSRKNICGPGPFTFGATTAKRNYYRTKKNEKIGGRAGQDLGAQGLCLLAPNLEPPLSVIRFRDLYRLHIALAVSDNKAVR